MIATNMNACIVICEPVSFNSPVIPLLLFTIKKVPKALRQLLELFNLMELIKLT